MKERLRIQGLRKRWILNSVGPVILILVLAAILASATVANNYYGSARSTLEAKAKAGADYFNSYSMSSYSEYYRNASLYAASFDSTRIELQFLNLYGRVDNSTQGVAAGTAPQTPEIARALEGSIEVFSGKDPVTGESVMAVTTPLKFNGSTVAFMRYVTATRQIDHQILLTILIISAIIAGVICLVLISSLLFINSVVAPVAEVTDAAKRISGGSYGNDAMLRKTMSLVPKMNGAAVQTANFETEFDVNFALNPASINGNEVGVLLSFRSDEAGRPAEGYHTVANNKDAILIHPLGVGIYDGVAADYSYSYVKGRDANCVVQSDGSYCNEFTAYNNGGEKANSVHVYAKLVGNQLTVKVTELGTETVLFEVTKTVNRMTAGYLYYSVCGAEVGLADLRLNLLDRDGNLRAAEDTANESYAGIVVTGADVRAAGGWDNSTNKYPGGNPYIDVSLAKKHGVYNSIKEYLNSRYDLYYQEQAELVKHASVFGNDAGDKGWYSHALYWQWVQFNSNGLSLNSNPTAIDHTAALVPKTADGAQMKGVDCIADMEFRFDNTDAAALFGFRMAEAGRFTDDAWEPVTNASFLKVTLSGVTLYDKGVATKIADYSYTPAGNLVMGLHVEVIGNQLTGYVTKGSNTHNFSATLTNMDAGYFAQGFGDKAPNIFPMTIQVGGMNIGKAEEVAGGKLTVTRTASDKEGYHAWKVTVNKDAGEQLKPNTLVGTDAADGSTLYPTRVGFQSDNHNADSFIFYSKGDATFTADFYTPHTAADISIPCLGTSVNETKAGLRFINRINLYTAADGKVYTDIDGVPTEVADYGVMVATKAVLGEREMTYELAQGTNRIVRRSVLAANKYFDYSTDYVDIAVQVTGLDQNGDLEICSRVYLKLANGTILYSDMATRTYNQARA